jgi:hypothetical protein
MVEGIETEKALQLLEGMLVWDRRSLELGMKVNSCCDGELV